MAASIAVGVVTVVVMALLARSVFRHTPESLAQTVDGGLASTTATAEESPLPQPLPDRRLWRNRAFLTLAAGMALGLFAQIGLLAHLYTLLAPRIGEQSAGWLMGGATAVAIVGRSVATRLLHGLGDRRLVAVAGYAVQAVGSLLLLYAMVGTAGEPALGWLVLGVVLFGSGIGNATSLPPLIAQRDFAAADVQRVVSLIVAGSQATYAFAPAVFAAVISQSSSGSPGSAFFLVAAGVQCAASCALLIGRRNRR